MSQNKVTGRERERDDAEAWLARNDPEYKKTRRSWQTPSTDALARDRSEDPALHELQKVGEPGDGNYRRPSNDGSPLARRWENEFPRAHDTDKDSTSDG